MIGQCRPALVKSDAYRRGAKRLSSPNCRLSIVILAQSRVGIAILVF
ncbi:MAG TPA: hypothetical protein VFA91_16155 [Candidatus Polarisedimenticolia bacterium]|nr:hypothetical protein [Candidatus Polarisedimenticolia bacterium]